MLFTAWPVQAEGERWMAVIDAGSSGSRLHLYRLTADPSTTVDLLLVDRSVPRPLSDFDGRRQPVAAAGPEGVGPALRVLTDRLKGFGVLPSQVTVHVLATAGMRLVDGDTGRAIYRSVAQSIADAGYRVGRTETISGAQEAIYAWVDVNHMLGRLRDGAITLGVIDVGGASSQVVFAMASGDRDGGQEVVVQGRPHRVVAVSYLGLGQNEARRAMLAHPASGGLTASKCYPHRAAAPDGVPPPPYESGLGDVRIAAASARFEAGCSDAYRAIIQQVGEGASASLPIGRLRSLIADHATRFVGLSSIFYAVRDWGLDPISGVDGLRQRVNVACAGDDAWPRVQATYRSGIPPFVHGACANGTFIDTYLYSPDALALQTEQVTALEEVNGQPLTWTRGAVLLAADQAPRTAP